MRKSLLLSDICKGAAPENNICAICQHIMTREEQLQALPCMHVFHNSCLADYCKIVNKSWLECCPYKCQVAERVPGKGNGRSSTAQRGSAILLVWERTVFLLDFKSCQTS